MRLRVRVIIADIGSAVGLGHSDISHELGYGLGFHCRASIRMDGELAGLDSLFGARLFDELPGQSGAFTMGHHPADHITAEDVQDDIEVKIGPLYRPFELCDIPRPHLIRFTRKQFGLFIDGPSHLPAALLDVAVLGFENPIHGANGAVVLPFIEQGGIDLSGSIIQKTLRVQQVDHVLTFPRA